MRRTVPSAARPGTRIIRRRMPQNVSAIATTLVTSQTRLEASSIFVIVCAIFDIHMNAKLVLRSQDRLLHSGRNSAIANALVDLISEELNHSCALSH